MILRADSITCRRGRSVVLRDVSFALNAGQSMAVTGANGSGKSTLLRALAGLNDPLTGTINAETSAHWIGPTPPLKPTLTVHDNLTFWLAMQGGDPANNDAIIRALHHFEIAHLSDRLVSTLSSGQKQRAALARLFLTPEKIWLLDEPESALDATGREMMLNALNHHTGDSGAALIATHNPDLWNTTITLPLISSPSPQRGEGAILPILEQQPPHHNPLPAGARGLYPVFTATLCRDLNLFLASKADALQPLMLFILMIALFPLSLGPDAATLAPIAGGLVMMAAFFALLLPLENIFADDAGDGTIETIISTSAPLPVYTAARMFGHWLANGLSVTILSPLALIMLGAHTTQPLMAAAIVLAATLLFTLIGSAISALVLSTRKGAILLALLAAPLYIPVLIFGSGGLGQLIAGSSPATPMLLLWAMVAVFVPLAPLMAAGCLRLMRD